MNSNSTSFTNNGAGLTWKNNYSQIYDDAYLNIKTDDSLYISAPTQISVTSANSYFSGNMNMNNNLLATHSYGNSLGYIYSNTRCQCEHECKIFEFHKQIDFC